LQFKYLADKRPQLDKLAEFYGSTLAKREGRVVAPDGLTIVNFELLVNMTLGFKAFWTTRYSRPLPDDLVALKADGKLRARQ